ncbi:putative fimbrial-like protein YbgD [Achromobacter dolens]|uniref:fimbrial protein n=1 Tax=Achromobacter dolens TaxID=1287738 RepID=UPI001467D5FC|nr:fimbrial protein [Achromobacter dolens]CAB3863544.1 putative fimbrial-like protein YbgD [Achromobacter dolens]
MIKKSTLALAAAVAFHSAPGFAAGTSGSGTITFSATVIEGPCSISAADSNMTIDLGQVSQRMLNGPGKFSDSVPVVIHLTGCSFDEDTGTTPNPNGKLSKVAVQFLGTFTNTQLGKISSTGTATAVAVQLLESDGTTPVNLAATPSAANAKQLTGGGNELRYWARMSVVGGPGAVTSSTGSVQANVTYALAYL